MSMGLVADAAVSPVKGKRRRVRRAKLDRRTTLVRRSLELREMFTAEFMKIGADVESPLAKLRIEEAAFAVAVSQHAREKFIRANGQGDAADLVTVQRRADALVKRLGLADGPVARPDDGLSFAEEVERKWGKPAPARPPTIQEVVAEQLRRVAGSSPVPAEAESAPAGPGPDLGQFGDGALARMRKLLESVEGGL
jgi:hypothetical protein